MSERHEVRIDNQSVEVFITGEGVPVVLHPGGADDAVNYDHFAEALARYGFKTYAVNPRGRGTSVGPLDELSLHDLALDLATVIERFELAPAHIFGHAFGGRVARCLASDRPELVRSLCLAPCGGRLPPVPEPHVLKALRSIGTDLADEELRSAFKISLVSPHTNDELFERIITKKRSWGFFELIPVASANTPHEEWVDGGDAPILIVQGLDDRISPPTDIEQLKREFGDRVELVHVPNAAHELIDEQPETVLESVVAFLNRM